jgi:hypothetical protein
MPKSVKNMLAEANASVPKLPPADAAKMMTGENVLIVDVRDHPRSRSLARSRAR